MTLHDFRILCVKRQATILCKDGVYIGKRTIDKQVVLLYQFDSFYVEIFYIKHRRLISDIKCVASTTILTPYLSQIDIEELVKCAG